MNELNPSHEPESHKPSDAVDEVLLDAARSYDWNFPPEGTISEFDDSGSLKFETEVWSMLSKQGGPDYTADQFRVDLDEIKRQIQEKGVETIILEGKAKQAEALAARQVSKKTATGLGSTGLRGLLGRRKR